MIYCVLSTTPGTFWFPSGFDPKPYHPSADSKLLPLGLITLSACSTRVSQPTHRSGFDVTDLSLSWLTGSSPWLVILQGQGGSLFCHDVLQGRLYVLSHSVSLFLKTGLRHCEAIYRAPLWRDRPLPSLWTCRDPDKAFLPTLLARSARRGLAAFYALWRLHLGSRSELSHPVLQWERTELVLTDWRRGRKEAERVGPSVAEHFARCKPLLNELCGEGGWLPFAFLSTSPHVWLILTEGGPVLAVDLNDTSVWRIADDLELLRRLGNLLLVSGLRLPLRLPSGSGEAAGEPGYDQEERRGRASTASATAATSTRGPTRPTRVTRKGRVATGGVHLPARPESEEQTHGHHGRQESSHDDQRGGSGRGHRDDGAHRHANDKTEPQQRGEHEEGKQTDSGRHEHAQESQVARRDEEGTEQGGSGRSCGGATQTYGGRGRHDSCPSIPLSVPGPDPRLWVPPPHLLFPSPLPPMTPVDDEPSVRPRRPPSPAEEPPTCRPRPPRPSSDTPLSAVSRPSAPSVPPPSTARVRFFLFSSSSPSYCPSPLSPPSPVSPSSPRSPFIPPIRSPGLRAKPRVSSGHPATFPPAPSSAPARFETVPSAPSSESPSAPCVGKSQPPAAHTA
ncbi:DR2 [Human betaherpesvirus 6A]|uniref:DR2 n=1 Tax=Human betaherpesvirus 6A TaxID=32603 RepID=W8FMG6_9BETA|nr:DR2 [Human betaherpesvirus 6A]AHK06945.1 DR2 [Human betaherpesvirus 6A]